MPLESPVPDGDLAPELYRWGVRNGMWAQDQLNVGVRGGEHRQRSARGQRPASHFADGATEAREAQEHTAEKVKRGGNWIQSREYRDWQAGGQGKRARLQNMKDPERA